MKGYPKRSHRLYTLLGLAVFAVGTRVALAQCQFVSGSTGADGAFSPTANTTRVLPSDGILNFTTVNIPSGVTVKFQRNQKNTPVYILASGNVTINGTIDVSGTDGAAAGVAGGGGPGGFDGGAGGLLCSGAGLGPGGGTPGCSGFSAGYGSAASYFTGASAYGNLVLNPLIGGSGGGASNGGTSKGFGGGGGGGAILIASSGTLNLSGQISANGGNGSNFPYSGGGSGGAIRVIATAIAGSGGFSATGGYSPATGYASTGRVRFEACDPEFTGNGSFSDTGPYTFAFATSPVFLSGVPTLSITSVGGTPVPGSPAGSFSAPPDISLAAGTTTATVQLAATGIPTGTAVSVRVTPQNGQPSTEDSTPLAGTTQSATASVDVTLTPGRSLITAQVTVTIGGGGSPLVVGSIAGERIAKVRVGATYGGASSLTYITESGKEIPAAFD